MSNATSHEMWERLAEKQRELDRALELVRWLLLPHIGYYLDGTPEWRWWMRLARWVWLGLGRLTRSNP